MNNAGVKLMHVGRKCAVLGVDPDNLQGAWHIVNPGSARVPAIGDHNKTVGTSLCRKFVITNGYAADWVPKGNSLCPACSERL